MLLWLSIPPHPTYQGGIDEQCDHESIWKDRLNNLLPLDHYWMKHQTRYENKFSPNRLFIHSRIV